MQHARYRVQPQHNKIILFLKLAQNKKMFKSTELSQVNFNVKNENVPKIIESENLRIAILNPKFTGVNKKFNTKK